MSRVDHFEDLREEVDRLVQLKGSDNWSGTRSDKNFKLIERNYSFGKRMCYERIDESTTYVDLQSSRSLAIYENDTLENVMTQLDDVMKINSADDVRIKELEQSWSSLSINLGEIQHTGFAELGYRVPRLMKHYSEKYDIPAWGYDVTPLSIGVTQKMGYDGREYDFNSCEKELDLTGASLIVSYHMLEHLSDPVKAIEKIYDSMDKGAFFHVEVPIEPGTPRLEFAHMFPFHSRDLCYMLINTGFAIISLSERTHEGGPRVERYLVRK